MKYYSLLVILTLILSSCGAKKSTSKTIIVNKNGKPNRVERVERREKNDKIIKTTTKSDEVITEDSNRKIIKKVIDNAEDFKGTKYKFGGTTKKGMDCSGLIYVAFQEENVVLPRVSRDMATRGKKININQAQEGDLVFFKTGSRNRINHVGLVTKVKDGNVYFIHSTTSKGVIESSIEERYWKKAFVTARRII